MDYSTLIGLIAAVFTTAAFIPQAVKTIRTRQTKDLSLTMYLTLIMGILLWLAYGLSKGDVPIILANGITLVFAAIIVFFKIKHG
jgi:MtN3 and saliva related transmembrane protein